MFNISDQFGTCPYDGFYIHALSSPRAEFIHGLQQGTVQSAKRRRQVSVSQLRYLPNKKRIWEHFVALPISDQQGALKVMWGPLQQWPGMPLCRIYFNPSRTHYDAQQTYELLLTILDDPLSALLVTLDTKVDIKAPYWWVSAHIYYPYARYTGHADWLPDKGTVYEGKWTRVNIYAKGGDHDRLVDRINRREWEDPEPPTSRVELRERFEKPRPTLADFLKGALVTINKIRYLKVVENLDKLGDRVLAAEAQERCGLTRALREYGEFSTVCDDDIQAMKDRINAISTREVFDLYRPQAEEWHRTFRG